MKNEKIFYSNKNFTYPLGGFKKNIKSTYNHTTNTYEFIKSRFPMDIELTFNLSTDSNLIAGDIKAWGINARNIKFDAVCWAGNSFICNSVRGGRENSKYFCLDNDVIIKNRR